MQTPPRLRVVVVSAAVVMAGCSFMQSRTQPVSVMASDPAAVTFVNGAPAGTGAATAERARLE